jgi:hypothetical protein
LIIGCWLLFLFLHLGAVPLFDWDEVNFAASAREMLITGDWERVTVNFEPFREKPPLFIWLQALSMYLWGIGTWAARFPNAIAGMITLWVLYLHAPRLYQTPTSGPFNNPAPSGAHKSREPESIDSLHDWGWPLMLMSGTLPFMYFRSGIIDPWFNLFMLLSILAMSQTEGSARGAGLKSGVWAGLAVLTKGPVGLLIPGLVAAWMLLRNPNLRGRGLGAFPYFLGASLVVSSLWFLPETLQNGPWFVRSFLVYQWELLRQPVAGHHQPWFYHLVVVFLGCFPFSIWAVSGAFRWRKKSVSQAAIPLTGLKDAIAGALRRRRKSENTTESQLLTEGRANAQDETAVISLESWMQATLWVVLVLFSLVSTKIIHYSSMAWVPLSALAWVGFQKLYFQHTDFDSAERPAGIKKLVFRRLFGGNTVGTVLTDWRLLSLGLLGSLVGLIWLTLAAVGRHPSEVAKYFAVGSFEWGMITNSAVGWPIYTYIPGILWILLCLWAVVLLARRRSKLYLLFMAVGLPATLWLIQILMLPRIEQMVQGPLRHWCVEYADQNQTVVAWGYRSYAPYWYNRWTPDRRRLGENPNDTRQKPVLYVMRIDRLQDLEVKTHFDTVKMQAGFALMRRKGEDVREEKFINP